MKLYVAWDTWGKNPPVISVGYDEKDAFNRHPNRGEILEDNNTRFMVGVVSPEAPDR